ncbi:MAG: M48 family metallopeptidase, partial [Campylobacterota bacterium]
YIKAANYAIAKEKIEIASSFVDLVMVLFWFLGGFALLQSFINFESQLLNATVFMIGFLSVVFIVGLPFDIYKTFKLDSKYGFNNTTPKLFILDQLKSIGLFLIFGTAVIAILSLIIHSFSLWWVYGFVFIFAIVVLINLIYPTLIAPMFNTFAPLKDKELQLSIQKMMQEVGFESSGIFVQDSSKRDSRLNAYFGGLGKTKRVVLFDTLVQKLSHRELLAVLGHELGHFKHGDLGKNIALVGGLLFMVFAIFGNIPDSIYTQLGVTKNGGVVLALIMLLSSVVGFIFMPIFSLFSRKHEYAADKFGSDLVDKKALGDALVKLVDENKSFPKAHPLYIFFYYSHPPVIERLKELDYDYR